ncbi:hypothetical protein [uncultured Methanobrevibacter sp.]|uniref:hypothetical protein n=1 Tax=uncultured Methanobrevibacter sp. TaxID=253161 RepID=UPI0026134756|nr:hypothetical protein [uncultured Methanobrevibacter sp.]
MLDEKGNFFIIEAILAIILLLIVILAFNSLILFQNSDYSSDIKNSMSAQEIMEVLDGKINFTDQSFLGDISAILKEKKNSKESIQEVSQLCDEKFKTFKLQNYRFSENNLLDGKTLASDGDYSKAKDISVASRDYGDYSYTLSVW